MGRFFINFSWLFSYHKPEYILDGQNSFRIISKFLDFLPLFLSFLLTTSRHTSSMGRTPLNFFRYSREFFLPQASMPLLWVELRLHSSRILERFSYHKPECILYGKNFAWIFPEFLRVLLTTSQNTSSMGRTPLKFFRYSWELFLPQTGIHYLWVELRSISFKIIDSSS